MEIIKLYRYKRLSEDNWHYFRIGIDAYNNLINEFGSIRNYLSSLIREKLEIEFLQGHAQGCRDREKKGKKLEQ